MLSVATCALIMACTNGIDESAGDLGAPATGAIVSIGRIPMETLRAGESIDVVIPVTVRDGYHIQSNPASNEFLIPLELRLEHADGIQFGDPDYPVGRPYRLEGTAEDLMTYGGTVSITVHVKASATASEGERLVKGSVQYQACDSRYCFFPASIPIGFTVAIAD